MDLYSEMRCSYINDIFASNFTSASAKLQKEKMRVWMFEKSTKIRKYMYVYIYTYKTNTKSQKKLFIKNVE